MAILFLKCCGDKIVFSIYRQTFTYSSCYASKNIGCLLTTKRQAHLQPEISRNFQRNPGKDGKIFKEIENRNAHKVFEDHPSYSNTVVVDPLSSLKNLSQNATDVFKYFTSITLKNLEERLTLEDAEFNTIAEELAGNFWNASFDNLLCTLCSLCLWPASPRSFSPNFKCIWNAADAECTKRISDWSNDQKLLVGDYWFHLRLSRITNYNIHMIQDLVRQSSSLTSSQIVQLLFYINLQRSIPQNLMTTLERPVETAVKQVSIPEISIICLGFFKTETQIRNFNTIRTIINRLSDDINSIDSKTIVGILKCLRKSFQPHITAYYGPLLRKLAANMHRWDLHAAVHSALLCSISNIFEPFLLDGVVDKIRTCLNDLRVKDAFKVLQCLSVFNYKPTEEFIEMVCAEVLKHQRVDEILSYPRDLVFISQFLAYLGYYDHNILRRIFDPTFIHHCEKYSRDIMHVLAAVDYCVQIECDSYIGPRVSEKVLDVLKSRRGNLPGENGDQQRNVYVNLMDKLLLDLKGFYGDDNVCVRHVLPHIFNPDVVVRFHPKKSDKPLSRVMQTFPSGTVVKPLADEIWVCVIICAPFTFAFKSENLCGMISMKKRQLEKLGFKVLLVSHKDLPKNDLFRRNALEKKLKTLEMELNKL